jgi:hypothetical protein
MRSCPCVGGFVFVGGGAHPLPPITFYLRDVGPAT